LNKSAQQYIEDAIKLYRRRRYQESLDTFELAIQINPTSVRALHGRGFVLAKMKEYKRALESYEQASKLAPNIAKIYLDMAEVFYMLKDYKKSGASYRKAVELDSNYGSIYRDKTQELFHEAINLRSRGLRRVLVRPVFPADAAGALGRGTARARSSGREPAGLG